MKIKHIVSVLILLSLTEASFASVGSASLICLQDAGDGQNTLNDSRFSIELNGVIGEKMTLKFAPSVINPQAEDLTWENRQYPTLLSDWRSFAEDYNGFELKSPSVKTSLQEEDPFQETFSYNAKWWDTKRIYMKLEGRSLVQLPTAAKNLQIGETTLLRLETGTAGSFLYRCIRK